MSDAEKPVPTPKPNFGDDTQLIPKRKIGELALEHGFIDEEQLKLAVKKQEELKTQGFRERIGGILVKKGVIQEEQLQHLLAHQAGERVFGDYKLLMKLGSGASSAVYKARRYDGRLAAIKLMTELTKAEGRLLRFIMEARFLQQFDHPNIVKVIELGEFDGYPYIALEYIEGESLEHKVERVQRLEYLELFSICEQVAKALQYALESAVIHRDVKPANILLAHQGATGGRYLDGTVKLIDFGIARAGYDETGDLKTGPEKSARIVVGTPYFMSPEQAWGRTDLDHRSDMFSLGSTLYFAASGEMPFIGLDAMEVIKNVRKVIPNPLSELRPDLPGGFLEFLSRLMKRNPKDRFETYEELLAALSTLRDQESGAGKA